MYTRRFFITATLAPLLLLVFALVGFFISSADVLVSIVVMLLVPYAVFAGTMILAGLNLPAKAIRQLAYRTPMILLLIQNAYVLLTYWLGFSLANDVIGLGGILIFISIYYIVVGYLYVFIMEQGFISYLFQRRSGFGSANNKHEKNRLVC